MCNYQNTSYGKVPLPDGISSRQIENVNGLDMHVLEARPDQKKHPLIILLHGFPELAYSWRKTMIRLASQGFVVVAPDQRGFGRTSGWSNRYNDPIEPFNLLNLTRDIIHLVRSLGYTEVHTVIGHDSGSAVAGTCALARPDIFRSCIMMSAPYSGTQTFEKGAYSKSKFSSLQKLEDSLSKLKDPRKHYQIYFSSELANEDLTRAKDGIHQFLRAYYHFKSADWKGNDPFELESWDAETIAQMPTYYIMNKNQTMPETVEPHLPTAREIENCHWLPDEELQVYATEYERNTFQGGLQWYRCMTSGLNQQSLSLFDGQKIKVPSLFIAGKKDWGIYQAPGALEQMRTNVCTHMEDVILIEGAGHWVQQEQSESVIESISYFLSQHRI